MSTLSTVDVCRLTGLSYRQVDYLARSVGWTPGQGVRRRWSLHWVRALLIAKALAEPYGEWGNHASPLPAIAHAVAAGPPPPAAGWAAYLLGNVTYGSTPAEALGPLDGAIVARIPEHLP